jgi:DMSO/TMAO reductase YedYZ heme-binding membrane subunit
MRPLIKISILLLYCLAFIIPGATYFTTGQAIESLTRSGSELSSQLLILFRLFGLYAFVLTWSQVMLSTLRIPLQKLFGSRIVKMHIFLGTFTLLFALTHYLMFTVANLLVGIGPLRAISEYLGPYTLYGYLGLTAFYLMVLTVASGLLRAHPFMQNHWRKIHYLNYLIFIFVFIHSFFIGSDTQTPHMKLLYIFFGGTYVIGVFYKWGYKRILKR